MSEVRQLREMASSMSRLDNKVAFVTGSSCGIGAAIGRLQCAKRGSCHGVDDANEGEQSCQS
jgi:NAD(P)-dependent dehydrogenase (short-subunit alcohol dehydrogenase family)